MATFSGAFAELLEPRLREVYFNEYDQEPLLFPQVFNRKTSKRAFEDALKVSGFGPIAVKGEGQPVAYDDPIQSDRKRTVHTVYALGFRVTMEMADDDLYGIIDQMPKDLARSTRHHQETLAWGVFNDAFAGAVHTTIGGDNLCQIHALLKSTNTYENQSNPPIALSVTGMEDLLTIARTMVDESDRFTPGNPKTLIVPPDLKFEADRLLDTTRGEPGTDENQINTVATNRIGVTQLDVPYLTSDTAWFLVNAKGGHTLHWFDRKDITWGTSKDTQTKDALYDILYRAHVTVDNWAGVWGSSG